MVGETGRGDEAVELAPGAGPDLAILDIKMPGSTAWRRPRRSSAEQLCGVLILTAFSQRDFVEQARDAGALAYLVKPFQKSDLVPAIELAIGRFRELRRSPARSRPRGAARGAQARSTGPRAC